MDIEASVEEDLFEMRLRGLKAEGKKPRVYTCGSFDLFNCGHSMLFKSIKEKIPDCELVVGIYSDYDIRVNKGKNVMYEEERLKAIQCCTYVDLIYFPAPWMTNLKFYEEKNIDFVAGEVRFNDEHVIESDYDEIKFLEKRRRERKNSIRKWREEQNESNLKLSVMYLKPLHKLTGRMRNIEKKNHKRLFMNIFKPQYQFPQIRRRITTSDDDISFKDESQTENTNISEFELHSENELSLRKKISEQKSFDEDRGRSKVDQTQLLQQLKDKGMYLETMSPNVRTSDLVIRILRERKAFYERNIRKGFSRSALNLGLYDYYSIKIKLFIRKLCYNKKKMREKKDL